MIDGHIYMLVSYTTGCQKMWMEYLCLVDINAWKTSIKLTIEGKPFGSWKCIGGKVVKFEMKTCYSITVFLKQIYTQY